MTLAPEMRCLATGDDGYSLLQWGDPSKPGRLQSVRMPSAVAEGIVAMAGEIDRLRAVIRETHRECGESHVPNQRHLPGCKLYEIEP
jgi:hypothetical protein